MKRRLHAIRGFLVMILMTASVITVGAQQGGGSSGDDGNIAAIVAGIPAAELDSRETGGLLLMREEEKLARDVYTALYKSWGLNVFRNIAASEQTHMDSIAMLLDRYDLKDPVGTDTAGVFKDEKLQQLHNDLVRRGSESLPEALRVGAMIEDLDIKDLAELRQGTDNPDIKVVYQNLEKGSRNHLRTFISQIERNGGSYEVQFMEEGYYDKIIATPGEGGGAVTDPDFQFYTAK